jgi:hypothetical protein
VCVGLRIPKRGALHRISRNVRKNTVRLDMREDVGGYDNSWIKIIFVWWGWLVAGSWWAVKCFGWRRFLRGFDEILFYS